jgi:hypothetical protein
MKKAKLAFVALFALVILAVTYFVGYRIGQRDDDRQHLALSLDMDVNLYQKAESGDLAGVKSRLGFFIYGQFNAYERRFGQEPFLHFDDARKIATLAATNGDVVSFK